MDDNHFDDLGRALSALDTRRGALRLLVGAALGILAGDSLGDALAKPKGKGKGKGQGKGKRRNKQKGCVRTPCSGGKEFDTDSCQCRCPRGMRECRDGCVGPDGCCPADPPCPEEPKGCCHAPDLDVCTIDGCCRELDGMKACNNFCVDTTTNANHCGGCNVACGPAETCVAGECRPVSECPNGGTVCQGRSGPFCAPAGHTCCGDTFCSQSRECCDPTQGLCCDKSRCLGGQCCPSSREVCAGQCCEDFRDICCGDQCCPDFDCLNGSCCTNRVCGMEGSRSRICPTDEETCCRNDDGSGYACPADGSCATDGNCCPVGTFYEQACDKCCADVGDLCSECVPMFVGRAS